MARFARARALKVSILFLFSGLSGCSSDANFTSSANVAGDYTISLTNAENGCALENWEVGKSNTGIAFSIAQDGTNVTGTLQGGAALVLGLFIGSNVFTGSAMTRAFEMTAYGTIPRQQGNCAYTLNAGISGQISDDAISGTIAYAPAISDNPDCASVQCSSVQNFNGTRPPPAH